MKTPELPGSRGPSPADRAVPQAAPTGDRPTHPHRRPYARPVLSRHGRLVDVTLGGSPGVGDSGGGVLIQNPLG